MADNFVEQNRQTRELLINYLKELIEVNEKNPAMTQAITELAKLILN